MPLADYPLELLRLTAVVGSALIFARSWRRRWAPGWPGSLCLLADATVALAFLTVASEVAGSAGLFRRDVLIPILGALALVSWVLTRSHAPASSSARLTSDPGRLEIGEVVITSASVALVTAEWMTWVAQRIWTGVGNAGGPADGDTLWYHMPTAALFVKTGWTSRLPFLNGEALVTYYPANTPLLHAIGLLAMGNDVLSPLLNLAMVPLALVAGWCIGEGARFGSAGLASVAVALTMPIVVTSEAGTAKDDMLGFLGLLVAVAFLVHPRAVGGPRSACPAALVSGLAAGLALGSKVTFVVPILILGAGLLVLTPRARRWTTTGTWLLGAVCTGGYWYLRNFVTVGNPLPGLHIGMGSFHLPQTPTPSFNTYFGGTLWHVLTNWFIWRHSLLPGISLGMGAAWPLILAIVAVAVVFGLVTLRGMERIVPVTGAGAALAFLITPGVVWAAQLAHRPGVAGLIKIQFAYQVRYLLPAIAIGLTGVTLVARTWKHGQVVVLLVLGLTLLSTQLGIGQTPGTAADNWFPGHVVPALLAAVLAAAAAAAVVKGLRSPGRATVGRIYAVSTVAAVGLAAVLGRPLEDYYMHYRYSGLPLAVWANHLHDARIGYSGFVFSYPLYGERLQNQVEMIGQHGPDGSWHPVTACLAWRREVRAAHLSYVVVPIGGTAAILGLDLARWHVWLPGSEPPDEPPESRWTRDDPGARLAFTGEGAAAYTVSGPVTSAGCRSGTSRSS